MRHVFVETNWVFGYAAPAHHKQDAAVKLLDQARRNELRLHVPALCLMEARRPVMTQCQPRDEAKAIREFLSWAKDAGSISPEQASATRHVLERFENQADGSLIFVCP
jgi:predicted nucleic acid-binding protein